MDEEDASGPVDASPLSYSQVGRILQLIEDLDYDQVVLEWGSFRIELARAGVSGPSIAGVVPGEIDPSTEALPGTAIPEAHHEVAPTGVSDDDDATTDAQDLYVLRAPMMGTLYRAPSPGEAPFVEVGDRVVEGQVVAIIEVMKLMNHVVSDVDGVVRRILVTDGSLVQFDEPLVTFEIQS